jgi:hypothetical protein
MISLKSHNIADYCLGAAFLVAPFVFGFAGMYFAHDVFTVLGFAVLGYSLLTDYRHSLVKAIPLSMHITFDVVVGAFAVLAPWIYGYREELTGPQMFAHWLLGIGAIASAAMTDRVEVVPTAVIPPRREDRITRETAEERRKRAA